ncbi:MAG: hypothetical protein JNK82_13385, partial [Myxococcaceae bacterium]|nr:hypothetical protein [Myxococcaceae bacterium]
MFERTDAACAREVRDRFSRQTLVDFDKLLAFAADGAVLARAEAEALRAALRTLQATPGWSARSELINTYFKALGPLRERRPEARAALLGLGNVLAEDCANGLLDAPLPVWGEACPAAPAGYRLPAGSERVGTAAWRAAHGEGLRQAIASTWLKGANGGPAVRSKTGPVLEEAAKYFATVKGLSQRGDSRLVPLELESLRAGEIVQQLGLAMELIASVDPEQAGEVRALTEYVVLLEGHEFVGGSDLRLFGASFFALDPRWSPLCYADHLVHEAAHQLLHATQELEPLLLNRSHMGAPSPIRADPRPLYGTFHATFVFLRLASFMSKVVERRPHLEGEARLRLHRHMLGLLQGLEVVRRHAELSPAGEA